MGEPTLGQALREFEAALRRLRIVVFSSVVFFVLGVLLIAWLT
jgi:hypothetical protein